MRPVKYCQRACDAPLPDGAHINETDARRMRLGYHPVDDEKATQEIYGEAEIPQGVSFNLAEPRQRR